MSLTFKLKMVFSVLCFFFKPASWHLLLYQYRSIHFDTHISKEHSPIKSCVPCAPFILWAPVPPKVSARPCVTDTVMKLVCVCKQAVVVMGPCLPLSHTHTTLRCDPLSLPLLHTCAHTHDVQNSAFEPIWTVNSKYLN